MCFFLIFSFNNRDVLEPIEEPPVCATAVPQSPSGCCFKEVTVMEGESAREGGGGRCEVFFTSGAVKCGVHSALTYSLIGHSLLLKKGHRPPVIHLVASRGRICFFWHATNRNYLFTVPVLRLLLLLGLPLALCSRIQIQFLCLHRGTAILFKTLIAG